MSTVNGGSGNDSIEGTAGNDSLSGNDGNDTIEGQGGSDTIHGGAGSDNLDGGDGSDTITGGSGRDTITGDTGDDSIDAGDDDDTVEGGAGSDTVEGGRGRDRIWGGDGNDSLSGGDQTDRLYGEAGDDTMSGGRDNDTMYGGQGTDSMSGDHGRDFIYGEDGDDTIHGGHGDDVIQGGEGRDSIDGGTDHDHIDGGSGHDTVEGGHGRDTLLGGDGDDSLSGGTESDHLYGEQGDDTLDGGAGRDTLEGGAGDDVLTGGDGSDTFVYTEGHDTITDFNFGNDGAIDDGDQSNNDFIDLSDYYDNLSELHADQADDGILNQSNTTDTDGNAVDYSDNTEFQGGSLTFTGATADESTFTTDNTGVVCFTAGTMILTPRGERPIESLKVGDLVVTRDNGPQALQWIGMRVLHAAELSCNPKLLPIMLTPKLTGGNAPLCVSPQHGVLLQVAQGEELVRAVHLARLEGGAARVMKGCKRVRYLHLLFDAHQIIFANGVATESLYPGPQALASLPPQAFAELRTLFPDLGALKVNLSYGSTARLFASFRSLPDSLRALSICETPENSNPKRPYSELAYRI